MLELFFNFSVYFSLFRNVKHATFCSLQSRDVFAVSICWARVHIVSKSVVTMNPSTSKAEWGIGFASQVFLIFIDVEQYKYNMDSTLVPNPQRRQSTPPNRLCLPLLPPIPRLFTNQQVILISNNMGDFCSCSLPFFSPSF